MRNPIGAILVSGMLWLATGCAQRNVAVTAIPTSDELPEIKEIQRTIPASVGVAGRGDQPRVQLVPRFEQPELTREERAILGEEEPSFSFLPYEFHSYTTGSLVGTWYGGLQTFNRGRGGAQVSLARIRPLTRTGGTGSVAVAVDTFGSRVAGTSAARHRRTAVGPRGGLKVSSDRFGSKVAGRKSRWDR